MVNGTTPTLDAALARFGLAYLPKDGVQTQLTDGRLVPALTDWCEPFSKYHRSYPSRCQPMPAFSWLVDAPRYRS